MSTTTEARDALLQPTPATAALDPQRFNIPVQRSSKEFKDDDEDPPLSRKLPSNSSRRPVNRPAATTSRDSLPRRALVATRKLWQEKAELVVCCGLIFTLLGRLCAASFSLLQAWDDTDLMWKTLMETSGFVNWPELEAQPPLQMLSAVTPIIATILSCVIVPWSLYTRSSRGMKLFTGMIAVTVFTCFFGFGLNETPSLPNDTVELLMSQTDAVANFNRGFCEAWCRVDEAGLAAFVRGDCGSKQNKVFDEGASKFDMKDWCLEAIAHQKFELTAEYRGVSPFAGLKGNAGRRLIYPRSDFLVWFYIVGLLLGMMDVFTVALSWIG